MVKKVFAITGATGNIGSKLTKRLLAEGHEVRAIARGTRKLKELEAEGAEVHTGSLSNTAFLAEAFKGAHGVFAMIPPDYRTEDMLTQQRTIADSEVEALKKSDVRQVVGLSSFGAHHEKGTGPIAGLHYFERRLSDLSGVDVVCLRAGFFMENFLQNIGLIKSAGMNGSALAPDLAVPMIATKDIAAAAAEHLIRADFIGRSVHYLLGPRDATPAEATRVLGRAIGKPELSYVRFSYDETRKALIDAGFSQNAADELVEMYHAGNEGLLRPTEPRSEKNTTPTTLEEWSGTFAAAFAAE